MLMTRSTITVSDITNLLPLVVVELELVIDKRIFTIPFLIALKMVVPYETRIYTFKQFIKTFMLAYDGKSTVNDMATV